MLGKPGQLVTLQGTHPEKVHPASEEWARGGTRQQRAVNLPCLRETRPLALSTMSYLGCQLPPEFREAEQGRSAISWVWLLFLCCLWDCFFLSMKRWLLLSPLKTGNFFFLNSQVWKGGPAQG